MAADETTLVIMDFPARQGAAPGLRALAESIAAEPGLIWKIWTEDHAGGRAGGIYLFDSPAAAQSYHAMHEARLAAAGVGPVRAEYRTVNAELTAVTRGPISMA